MFVACVDSFIDSVLINDWCSGDANANLYLVSQYFHIHDQKTWELYLIFTLFLACFSFVMQYYTCPPGFFIVLHWKNNISPNILWVRPVKKERASGQLTDWLAILGKGSWGRSTSVSLTQARYLALQFAKIRSTSPPHVWTNSGEIIWTGKTHNRWACKPEYQFISIGWHTW